MKARLPIKTMLRCLPVPEALRTERWILQSALSLAFFSRSDNIAIHLWPFISVAPENATNYMYVCWVSNHHGRFTSAWGVNDQGPCVDGIVNHLRLMLGIPAKSEFGYDEKHRIPWIRFATEIDPNALFAPKGTALIKPDDEVRTTEDMLGFVTALGEGLDEPLSRATGALSVPDAPDDVKLNYTRLCLQIGKLCREQALELVYWPTFLFQEALEDVDLFVDTIIPPHYIPVGPELWYPEQRIKLEFPDDDPRREWELSGFEISAIILLPTIADRNGCMTLFLFQTDMLNSEIRSPDDMVPRIMIAGEGKAGEPCCKFYHWIMGGIEFMAQASPGRTPHTYSSHEHKMAQSHNRKLQPYSIMEVRKVERADADRPSPDTDHNSPYKHSFFQRRHRRRLNKPRKSDGLQVIRVAAGQKCKHLPLLPEREH